MKKNEEKFVINSWQFLDWMKTFINLFKGSFWKLHYRTQEDSHRIKNA